MIVPKQSHKFTKSSKKKLVLNNAFSSMMDNLVENKTSKIWIYSQETLQALISFLEGRWTKMNKKKTTQILTNPWQHAKVSFRSLEKEGQKLHVYSLNKLLVIVNKSLVNLYISTLLLYITIYYDFEQQIALKQICFYSQDVLVYFVLG